MNSLLLKVKLKANRFSDKLDVMYNIKGVKDDAKYFSSSNRQVAVIIN